MISEAGFPTRTSTGVAHAFAAEPGAKKTCAQGPALNVRFSVRNHPGIAFTLIRIPQVERSTQVNPLLLLSRRKLSLYQEHATAHRHGARRYTILAERPKLI